MKFQDLGEFKPQRRNTLKDFAKKFQIFLRNRLRELKYVRRIAD